MKKSVTTEAASKETRDRSILVQVNVRHWSLPDEWKSDLDVDVTTSTHGILPILLNVKIQHKLQL